ncbi:MAG: diguanylate cyclase [Candidatus Neomarinimicrobiota bacterium]
MKNLKSVWFLSFLLIAVLFLVVVYPGIETLPGIPFTFQWVFKILVFVAFFSIVLFLLIEVKRLTRKIRTIQETDKDEAAGDRSDESLKELGLKTGVDPEKNYQEMTRQILSLAQSSLVAQTVFIYFYNEADDEYALQEYQTSLNVEPKTSFRAANSIFNNFHQSAIPRIFPNDVLKDGQVPYYEKNTRIGTVMLVPIFLKKSIFLGLLGMDSVSKEAWGEEDTEMAKTFAELYSQTIWQIDVIDKQMTQMKFFDDLCRMNNESSLGVDLLDLYKKAGAIIKKFYNFDKMTLATFKEEESRELRIEYIEGLEADYSIGHLIPVDGSLFQKVVDNGQILSLPDYEQAGVQHRFRPDDLPLFPFRSCLGVPLDFGRKRFGGILLESFKVNNFASEEAETLLFLGKNLSEIINRIRMHQLMKELALIDGLTGIYNQRAFKERFATEIERCRRFKISMTLFVLDLDNFKRINDTHGHLFGDFLLKKTASIIQSSVRSIDIVCRCGGEEFAVILVNADKRSCLTSAERIRSNIQNFSFDKDKISEKITVSIGISEYQIDGNELQSIFSAADNAMYQSKRAGGNRVTMYKPN